MTKSEDRRKAIMGCKHEHTLIANDYMAEWCDQCGACRFRNHGKLDDWQLPRATGIGMDEEKVRMAIYDFLTICGIKPELMTPLKINVLSESICQTFTPQQPAGLVALSEDKIFEELFTSWDNGALGEKNSCKEISKRICSKFATPIMPSVVKWPAKKDIHHVHGLRFYHLPTSKFWNDAIDACIEAHRAAQEGGGG